VTGFCTLGGVRYRVTRVGLGSSRVYQAFVWAGDGWAEVAFAASLPRLRSALLTRSVAP